MYEVTKRFVDVGSAVFRNHRAESHCRFFHGHNLTFDITWASPVVDDRFWVLDFGGLKNLKQRLEHSFDHVTIVAIDDPARDYLMGLEKFEAAQIRTVGAVSCEAFAYEAFRIAEHETDMLKTAAEIRDDVFVIKVVCHEDYKNSASFVRT